jgi:hypothetical protein
LQSKSAPDYQLHAAQPRRQPIVPTVYRPQSTPKILQTKLGNGMASRGQFQVNPTQPTFRVAHLPVKLLVTPQRINLVRSQPIKSGIQLSRGVASRIVVQRFQSGVVQATKFYPNLHPGAVESIDPSNIFRLNSFADQYRLHKVNSHGVNVPNQQYNFVRTSGGETLLHSRYRHPSIAEGKQVLYAGEIFFNNGQLQWWSNGSGHYQPDPDSAQQANLPMDYFFSYQQIIKGEHTRKKG